MNDTSKTLFCKNCNLQFTEETFIKNLKVCQHCGYHHYLTAHERLNLIIDKGSFEEYDAHLYSIDSLKFPDYPEKLARDIAKTGLRSEMLSGIANLGGHPTAIAVGDVGFIGGTCGSVIGEKVTRCIERALENKLPLIIVSVSGGMRMQEGTLALMQMAKTAAACAEYTKKGVFYISVVTDPTFGGATASYTSLGDVIIAEPGARIGFAGPLAVASLHEELPENFQKAEALLEHGFIDTIVHRTEMRQRLTELVEFAQE